MQDKQRKLWKKFRRDPRLWIERCLKVVDTEGNVYCCGPGGIHVFDPQATCLGVINVPEYTANFCFGDDDFRSLFVTASTSLYRLRVKVPGTRQGP